jgi:hypothetical protein
MPASQLLIDRKVHRGGSFGHRATAATIWAARGTATRVGYRDRPVPAVATAEAGSATVSWFVAGWLVVCAVPFQLTTAFALKLLPLTVKVKPGSP